MRKHLCTFCLLLAFALNAALFAGCAPAPAKNGGNRLAERTKSETSGDTFIFTDSAGRAVELPKSINRIAPAGSLAQIVLFSLCPDKIIGWSAKPSVAEKKYLGEKYQSLPVFGQFYGKNVSLNLESLIAAKPDVIIDVGEAKKTVKEDMDGIQRQTGIPVVFVEATLKTMPQAYLALGRLVGMDKEADVLAGYCAETIRRTEEAGGKIPDSEKAGVYYAEGEKGLQTDPSGSIHADVIDIVGGKNVAQIENAAGAGLNDVSMEQIILWKPDVILVSPGTVYGIMGEDPLWREFDAVQNDRYFEIPNGPYNWMGRPPSINRILGVKWLGNLLYPELYPYDMVKETRDFYNLFYHYNLSDEEVETLLANSTLKKK